MGKEAISKCVSNLVIKATRSADKPSVSFLRKVAYTVDLISTLQLARAGEFKVIHENVFKKNPRIKLAGMSTAVKGVIQSFGILARRNPDRKSTRLNSSHLG